MTARFTAVVLAAGRGGVDPVAAAAGRRHKCLVDIHGRTMLARVLEALAASASVGAVAIYFLEIFVGFLQAFVFMFLTAVFMAQLSHHGDEHHENELMTEPESPEYADRPATVVAAA